MLTYEKVLRIFSDYLAADDACEVLMTRHGYVVMEWETERRKWNNVQNRATPEEVNRIGHELALRWTKGRYAFIVATHVDHAHIHNHIVFNAVALDGKRKFRDFLCSDLALHHVSDRLCLEHRLPIIEAPKRGNHSVEKASVRTLQPVKKARRSQVFLTG